MDDFVKAFDDICVDFVLSLNQNHLRQNNYGKFMMKQCSSDIRIKQDRRSRRDFILQDENYLTWLKNDC